MRSEGHQLSPTYYEMEAKEAGFDNGVFIDTDGYVGDSSNMNVASSPGMGCLHIRIRSVLAVHVASPPGIC